MHKKELCVIAYARNFSVCAQLYITKITFFKGNTFKEMANLRENSENVNLI